MILIFITIFQISVVLSTVRILFLSLKLTKKLPNRSCKDFDYFYLTLFASELLLLFVVIAQKVAQALSLVHTKLGDECHPHFIVFMYTIQSASCVYLATNWAEIAGWRPIRSINLVSRRFSVFQRK